MPKILEQTTSADLKTCIFKPVSCEKNSHGILLQRKTNHNWFTISLKICLLKQQSR